MTATLAKKVWSQRWWRLAEMALPWMVAAVAVPFAALALGAALVASGFRAVPG